MSLYNFDVRWEEYCLRSLPSNAYHANAGNFAGAITGSVNLGSREEPRKISEQNVLNFLVDIETVLNECGLSDGWNRWVVLHSWICGLIKEEDIERITKNQRLITVKGLDRFNIIRSDHVVVHWGSGRWMNFCPFGQSNALVYRDCVYRIANPQALGCAVIERYAS